MKGERLYGFDNLKFFLIFSVVLGHFLEVSQEFAGSELLLRTIYSFHMPAFLFLTGYFAKFRPKKIVLQFGYTYVLFQVLYLLFAYRFLGGEELKFYFSFPYWLLWYLLAVTVYYLLLPLMDVRGVWKRLAVLLITVAAALCSGNDPYLGYGLSGARIVSFLPFFVLGFYCGKRRKIPLAEKKPLTRILVGTGFTAAAAGACVYLHLHEELSLYAMYGSIPYERGGYEMSDRAVLMLFALIWIGLLMTALLPLVNRRLPIISAIGKNTFCIFLLHGFFVKYMGYYGWPVVLGSLWEALLATVAILALCGNALTAWVFRRCLTGEWIEYLWEKGKTAIHRRK